MSYEQVSNYINDLVLYDGYDFVAPTKLELKNAVNATLYRNIDAGSYATIVCPFSITGGADGTFYQPSSMGTEYNTLNFESVSAPEAGKAYLYKANNAVTKLTGKPYTTVSTSIISNGTSFTMEGTYSNREKLSQGDYVLSGNSSGAGIYRINSDVSLSPFRAYFLINATASNAAKMAICLDGVPTAITQTKQAEGEKIPYYDLLGRRTGRPAQGMYITKGKTIFAR